MKRTKIASALSMIACLYGNNLWAEDISDTKGKTAIVLQVDFSNRLVVVKDSSKEQTSINNDFFYVDEAGDQCLLSYEYEENGLIFLNAKDCKLVKKIKEGHTVTQSLFKKIKKGFETNPVKTSATSELVEKKSKDKINSELSFSLIDVSYFKRVRKWSRANGSHDEYTYSSTDINTLPLEFKLDLQKNEYGLILRYSHDLEGGEITPYYSLGEFQFGPRIFFSNSSNELERVQESNVTNETNHNKNYWFGVMGRFSEKYDDIKLQIALGLEYQNVSNKDSSYDKDYDLLIGNIDLSLTYNIADGIRVGPSLLIEHSRFSGSVIDLGSNTRDKNEGHYWAASITPVLIQIDF